MIQRILTVLSGCLTDWRDCAVSTTLTLNPNLPVSHRHQNMSISALGALKPASAPPEFASVVFVPRQPTLYAQRQAGEGELGVPVPLVLWVVPPTGPPTESSTEAPIEGSKEPGPVSAEAVTQALADISQQELIDRGADIPLEGWLLALLQLCRGASAGECIYDHICVILRA